MAWLAVLASGHRQDTALEVYIFLASFHSTGALCYHVAAFLLHPRETARGCYSRSTDALTALDSLAPCRCGLLANNLMGVLLTSEVSCKSSVIPDWRLSWAAL